ncbi:hypothetical protein MMM2322_00350 [Microbacterium sp. MM2322]
MVVKPFANLTRTEKGLVQPGIKVRGREYLRIIYGPDYTDPANLGASATATSATSAPRSRRARRPRYRVAPPLHRRRTALARARGGVRRPRPGVRPDRPARALSPCTTSTRRDLRPFRSGSGTSRRVDAHWGHAASHNASRISAPPLPADRSDFVAWTPWRVTTIDPKISNTGPIDLAALAAAEDGDLEMPEISYDEQRYPARPRRLRPKTTCAAAACAASVPTRARRTARTRRTSSGWSGSRC